MCGIALMLSQAASCSIDSRKLTTLTLAEQAGGDASAGGGAGPEAEGLAPRLALEPAALDFGQAVVGAPSRGRVAIVNTGDGALPRPLSSWLPGSDAAFSILHDQCENTVAPGERCEVRLQLLPAAPGPIAATLGVESSGQSAQVSLAGVALGAGPLTVAPAAGSSADFGGVVLGSGAQAVFEVSNPTADASGPLAFAINEAQFQLVAPGAGDCQPGLTTLVDGESCLLRIDFAPSRRGPADGVLVATSASLGSTALALAGAGRVTATLVASDVLDFGDVVLGGAGQRTLRVGNSGDLPLTLSSVTLAGVPATTAELSTPPAGASTEVFSLQNSNCGAGTLLEGGEECSVTALFRPLTAAAGQQAQLLVGTADGALHTVTLAGNGLGLGALTIAPADGTSNDFGELSLGVSATQTFIVSNPSAQPSGPIELRTLDPFVLSPPSAEGDCQSGITSLVDGAGCAVAVSVTPEARGRLDGSLIASSVLAGAANLTLTGTGFIDGTPELVRSELDFGRVPAETPVQQTLTLRNAGDRPIAGVRASVEGTSGGPAPGFSLQSPCAGPLQPGASCDLGVQFLPDAARSYAALLRVSTDAGSATSALLSGSAFPRGSLAIASVGGASDFGDVALGSPSTLQFTLSNTGTIASGRITITSSSNLFAVDVGDCNPEGGAGLPGGGSCTFSVAFNPSTSELISANLSVQSPGAGETALPLSGRGRTPPNLTATNNRDFGQGNVNDDALREPANEFTWTVTNEGDLPSGPLAVVNDNGVEFVVVSDTCSNVAVPGQGTCTLGIRFRPSTFGPRTGNLDVTDGTTAQVLRLAMTGAGRVIAQPGESCINAECATGECTAGVCCDRDCSATCQVCSGTGVCEDQAARQACGTGAGLCFGVNQCLLPEGQACSGDEQCGDGNCEQRLGGQGAAERICCLDDCGNTGQQCNPTTGRCEVPTLAAGTACGAAGQLQCGAGLECKECLGGGRQCTPSGACCGGCLPGYDCINGECGCPTGSNGVAQIDCGNGQCVLNRLNACCTSQPECAANVPVCDGQAGLCRQCLQAADCPPGPTGTFRACTNFTCTYACSTQEGFKTCPDGSCLPNNQCCGGCTAPCTECVNGSCQSECSNGQTCGGGGTCQFLEVGAGQACSVDDNCPTGLVCRGTCQCPLAGQQFCGGACVDTATRADHCGGCNVSCTDVDSGFVHDCVGGQCTCGSASEIFVRNGCRFVDGQICGGGDPDAANALCASNNCSERFIDGDGDGVGSTALFLQCGNTPDPGFALVGGDPDDADPAVR